MGRILRQKFEKLMPGTVTSLPLLRVPAFSVHSAKRIYILINSIQNLVSFFQKRIKMDFHYFARCCSLEAQGCGLNFLLLAQ